MATANTYRRALSTNATATSFTAKTPTATKPSGNGVFDLLASSVNVGVNVPRFIDMVPYGTDGSNDTFSYRVWGWSKLNDATLGIVWIPRLLLEASITIGNVAATVLGSGNCLADTISIVDGDATSPVISTESDTGASIIIHSRGSELIEFDWDLAGAQEAVSMNCLWKPMDQ